MNKQKNYVGEPQFWISTKFYILYHLDFGGFLVNGTTYFLGTLRSTLISHCLYINS
jgi:hypothetical protein